MTNNSGSLMNPRSTLFLGTLSAAMAVSLGAFGAHWLESQLPRWYNDAAVIERMRHTWEVGVRYQMYHALGLILLGLWGQQKSKRSVCVSTVCFFVGSLLFSGLLYALVLTGKRWLGAIVPFGGGMMIVGWLAWSWQAWCEPAPAKSEDDREAEKLR